jgi:chemotaxis protein CheX
MAPAKVNRFGIDSKLILLFVESVRRTLTATAGWESAIEKPRLKTEKVSEYDYSGIITISGDYVGTVVVSFHRATAIQLVTAMVHCEIPPETPDFCDAIGEITNMIAGGAKNEFGGRNTAISIPTVVMGKGHRIARPSDIPCILVPCRTLHGDFAVEVCIKSQDSDSSNP